MEGKTALKTIVKQRLQWKAISPIAVPIIGAFFGMIVGSFTVVSEDAGVFKIVALLLDGAFGDMINFSESLIYTIPLGFTGLAIVFSYKASVFNIGAEGQLHLSAVIATLIGTSFAFLPPFAHIGFALLAGAVVGGLWAFLPGLLRAYKGFNEIVTTMLLNYIAILFVGYIVHGPMKEPDQYFPQSARILESATLGRIVPGLNIHTGLFIYLAVTLIIFFLIYKTTLGFRIRSVGFNPSAAKYAGTNVPMTIVWAMTISGALAGIAGVVEISGVHFRLMEGFSPGYGYDAIAVALLANLNPIGVLLSAFFFGALRNAASNLQISLGVSTYFVYVVQSVAVLFVISSSGVPRWIMSIKRRLSNVG